jgi:ubiquinone/menaquinone biosynthesis C-methylase UbiE
MIQAELQGNNRAIYSGNKMKRNSKSKQTPPDRLDSYYEGFDEEHRLLQGTGQLELARTQEIIQRYLRPPPAVIYDVGGAAGIYSCWLARLGYTVHLIDPVPSHVSRAAQTSKLQPNFPIKSCRVGDARRLDFPDASADFILFFGPMYHLNEKKDRLRALNETRRVLKESGILFIAAISRFASILDGLFSSFLDDPRFVKIVKQDLSDGKHRNPTDHPHYFTTAHFHHPEELKKEIEEAGFFCERILPVEGLGGLLQDFTKRWQDSEKRIQLIEALRWIEDEPSLLGATHHLLAVVAKNRQSQVHYGSS